jgi:ATP-dependent RNA helicase DDX23/PRP28
MHRDTHQHFFSAKEPWLVWTSKNKRKTPCKTISLHSVLIFFFSDYVKAVREHTEDGVMREESKSVVDRNVRDDGMALTKHWSEKPLEKMTDRDWRIFREDHEIIIKGGRVPRPIRDWCEAELPQVLHDNIKNLNYKKPTSIQVQAIPVGLTRRDLIGLAPTGSGKTAAFLIPLINYLSTLPPITSDIAEEGPYGLIVTPTRELAVQIHSDFQKMSAGTKLRSTVVVGGKSIEEQSMNIRKGVELLVGTPGRLKDALESRYTVLNQCTYVLIDEADRMMDMGLEEPLQYILDCIPTTNLTSDREVLSELQKEKSKQISYHAYVLC